MTIYRVSQMIKYLEDVLENEGEKYVVNNLGRPVTVSKDWNGDICIE